MRFSFDALCGLVNTYFGMNPLNGHVFVFLSRSRDRMKVFFWDIDGFALYYKRLERGSYSWIMELGLEANGEMQASDFSLILAEINPNPSSQKRTGKRLKQSPEAQAVAQL